MSTACTNFSLAQSLQKLQLIADAIPAAIVIHEVATLRIIYMNSTGLEGIGATLEELQNTTPEAYHAKYMNDDDSKDYVPKIMHIIKSKANEQASYFQQVRSGAGKEWRLFASNTKVFCRDSAGDATHIITIASLLDPVHHISAKVNRLVEEVSFFRENNPLFLQLTRREREILSCMALGMNSGEIGEKLFISSATADTHRRNIRSKLGLKNNYDTVKFAQAYNLV